MAKQVDEPCLIQFDVDDGQYIDIILEHESCYGEWIKGEGGDICLYRSRHDDRVVGAHLPLYAKSVLVACGGGTIEVTPPGKIQKDLMRKALNDIFKEASVEGDDGA